MSMLHSIVPLPATLAAEDLGRLICPRSEAPRALVNTRQARGLPLPPSVQLPGARQRIWLAETVLAWLASYESATTAESAN